MFGGGRFEPGYVSRLEGESWFGRGATAVLDVFGAEGGVAEPEVCVGLKVPGECNFRGRKSRFPDPTV